MHAYEIPGLRFSLPAGGAVARHRFVSVSDEKAVLATTSTRVVGVSMNQSDNTTHVVEIADGIVMVEAAGAITSGADVYSDATGKASATGTEVVGVAITASTGAGQLIAVKM